jgi:4-amino-4-deoxy-L-arabinose transferase-like glycosyltransferase
VSTGLTLLSWTFLMRPIVLVRDLGSFERLVLLAYPAGDVLIIVMLVRLLTTPGARTVSYRFLVAGLVPQLCTDTVYALLLTRFSYSGGAVDVGWLLAYICVGVAALHPSIRPASEVAPAGELVKVL